MTALTVRIDGRLIRVLGDRRDWHLRAASQWLSASIQFHPDGGGERSTRVQNDPLPDGGDGQQQFHPPRSDRAFDGDVSDNSAVNARARFS
jgi:hypothetical protein